MGLWKTHQVFNLAAMHYIKKFIPQFIAAVKNTSVVKNKEVNFVINFSNEISRK